MGPPLKTSPKRIDSRLLSRLRRPVGRFNTELLGVLGVQSLPAELHGLGAHDAADGLTGQKPIQHIEADVPPGSAHLSPVLSYLRPAGRTRCVLLANGHLCFLTAALNSA